MNDNMNSNLNEPDHGPVVIPADALNNTPPEPIEPATNVVPSPVTAAPMVDSYTPSNESALTEPVVERVEETPVMPEPIVMDSPVATDPIVETPVNDVPTTTQEPVFVMPESIKTSTMAEPTSPVDVPPIVEPTPVMPTPVATEPVSNPNVNVTVEVQQPKRKKHTFRKIFNIVFTLVVLVILANTILAVMNFNQLANQQEAYVFNDKTEGTREDGSKYTIYGQGFYKIVHEVKKDKAESWALKPFFLN